MQAFTQRRGYGVLRSSRCTGPIAAGVPSSVRLLYPFLFLPDPGRDRLVAAPTGVVPSAPQCRTVLAKGALVVGGRTPVPEPDRKGVTFELVGIVERVARLGVEAALHVRARLAPQ